MSWCGGGLIRRDAGGREADLGDPGPDLLAGELSPFAGLGPLRNLDLNLVGAHEVFAGHAEPARGHLLDLAPAIVAVGVLDVPRGVFAPLAGVAPAADPVHGDGQGLVGLAGLIEP